MSDRQNAGVDQNRLTVLDSMLIGIGLIMIHGAWKNPEVAGFAVAVGAVPLLLGGIRMMDRLGHGGNDDRE